MITDHEVYYFGCWSRMEPGHFLYNPRGRNEYILARRLPWPALDTCLCPGIFGKDKRPIMTPKQMTYQAEGSALLHHKGGWTALAFWDRSGDERYNSNSVILARGEWSFDEMTEQFRRLFPTIYGRMSFEIKLATEGEVHG